MSYKVYLASYLSVREDHHAIFIETDIDGSGYLFHVVGNTQVGMSFGHRPSPAPEKSPTFLSKKYIGSVTKAKYDRVEFTVGAIEPPKKQFDGSKRINPEEPLRACQEWAADAIQALRDAGILGS